MEICLGIQYHGWEPAGLSAPRTGNCWSLPFNCSVFGNGIDTSVSLAQQIIVTIASWSGDLPLLIQRFFIAQHIVSGAELRDSYFYTQLTQQATRLAVIWPSFCPCLRISYIMAENGSSQIYFHISQMCLALGPCTCMQPGGMKTAVHAAALVGGADLAGRVLLPQGPGCAVEPSAACPQQ